MDRRTQAAAAAAEILTCCICVVVRRPSIMAWAFHWQLAQVYRLSYGTRRPRQSCDWQTHRPVATGPIALPGPLWRRTELNFWWTLFYRSQMYSASMPDPAYSIKYPTRVTMLHLDSRPIVLTVCYKTGIPRRRHGHGHRHRGSSRECRRVVELAIGITSGNRASDVSAKILARMSVSVSVSASWNSSLTEPRCHVRWFSRYKHSLNEHFSS